MHKYGLGRKNVSSLDVTSPYFGGVLIVGFSTVVGRRNGNPNQDKQRHKS